LDLTDDVRITGPGADKLTVSGSHLSRVFKVEAGETVSISGLTIAEGNAGNAANGGGIDNFGTLTVRDCVFSGNSAGNGGGGLESEAGATATVIGSTFTGNSAIKFGGGIDDAGDLNIGSIGGTLTVRGSTFTGNSVGD